MAERDTGLYDHQGRRIIIKDLQKELAAPTLTGLRTIWTDSVASGLTPTRLAGLLRDAAEGDHDAYLTLAEEIEERDLHYGAELSKRKLAVSRLPITVESASDDSRDKMLADEVRALLRKPGTRKLQKNLLDSLGKGFSVVEVIWQRGSKWMPQRYEWRDPHFFQFDRVSKSEIRLRDETESFNGLTLAPYKFICHVPLIKSGIPIRGGLARLAAWAYMCKGYTVKDWMAFAEIYGMPFRMGRYENTATEDDIAVLRRAVSNIGSDAGAVFPKSMDLELSEAASKSASADFYKILAQYLDDQVSKGVLGQTASSSGTPGKLGDEKLQSDVRDDIRDDDAEQLAETLNRDLVKPFIDLNWGPQEDYPCIIIAQPDAEDVQTLITGVKELVPFGLRVEQSVMRDKLGIPDPDPNAKPEDLLQPATSAAAAPIPEPQPAMNRQQSCPHCISLNAQQQPDLTDQATDLLAKRAQAGGEAWINQIKTLLDESKDLEEFQGRIQALAESKPTIAKQAELLSEAMAVIALAGMSEVQDGN